MEPELITIVGTILGSSLMTIAALLRQMNHLETKLESRLAGLDTKFDALDTKFTVLDTKVDALDTKVAAVEGKFEVMGRDVSDIRERLARVEGHLMAPEGFRTRGPQPPAAIDPPSEDPGSDQRQAG